MNTSEVYLVVDIFDPDPAVMYPGSFVGYRFQVSGSASLDKGILFLLQQINFARTFLDLNYSSFKPKSAFIHRSS